jgi:hypothetical protein
MVDMPNEDAAHISWYTAADYMWAPEKYNMKESMERAVLKAVSKDGIDIIRKYMAEIHKLQKNDGIPGTNKEEKIKNVKILYID